MVLDFFSGSGTTAEAVLELNQENNGTRQFILCEQMDYVQSVTVPRILHTIKQNNTDSFVYCELKKYNEAYMDKIQAAKSSKELVSLWKEIAENSFLNWYVNPEVPEEAVNDFIAVGEEGFDTEQKNSQANQETFEKEGAGKNLSKQSQDSSESEKEGKAKDARKRLSRSFPEVFKGNSSGLERQKRLLAELLNKNQLYVNLSEIEDKDFNVSAEDKKLNKLFFNRS